MSNKIPVQLTTGVIAAKLGVPLHRVQFYLNSRQVEATSRAGNARVFSEEVFNAIADYIQKTDAQRDALRLKPEAEMQTA